MARVATISALILLAALSGCGEYITEETQEIFYPNIPGIVAFYQFDGSLEDSAPDSIHAASNRTPVYVSDHNGRADAALYVSGVADTVSVPTRGCFDITGEFTLAAWIRPEEPPYAYASVVDKGFTEAYSMGIDWASAPDTTWLVLYVGDEDFSVPRAVPLGTGEWTHIACSFVDSRDVAHLYVNGALADSSFHLTNIGVTDYDLRIGNSQWNDAFVGAIDQLAVFDRALTQSEVSELYTFD
jgi:hypothetical protein